MHKVMAIRQLRCTFCDCLELPYYLPNEQTLDDLDVPCRVCVSPPHVIILPVTSAEDLIRLGRGHALRLVLDAARQPVPITQAGLEIVREVVEVGGPGRLVLRVEHGCEFITEGLCDIEMLVSFGSGLNCR